MDRVGNIGSAAFTIIKDGEAPTVTLMLPAESGLLVEVVWSGQDVGSGLERYDVEYWTESMGWTDLVTDTLDTDAKFVGEAGVSYTVRVTARDRVGNETQVEKTVEVLDVVKYYTFNGQRVAMRHCAGEECREPVYLHGDHLGSVSLATDASGNLIAQARYEPYGKLRWDGSQKENVPQPSFVALT